MCGKQVQLPIWIGLSLCLGDVVHAPGLGGGLARGDESRGELIGLEAGQEPRVLEGLGGSADGPIRVPVGPRSRPHNDAC